MDNSAANMSSYLLTRNHDIEEQNFIQRKQLAIGLVDLIENNNQLNNIQRVTTANFKDEKRHRREEKCRTGRTQKIYE